MIETQSASNSPDLDAWSRDLKDDLRDEAHERWAFIDRLAEGKAKFDAATFWAVIREIGLSKGTVNNRLSIGAKFPVSRRRENLLPAIHDEFRKLDDGLTSHALQNAEEGHWTREECRMRMKAFKAGDVQALELEWRPAPVRSKATPAEAGTEDEGEDDTSVFDATGAGQAMAAEERREKLDAYADQKFASGNDFFEQIAATIEKKGDPRRFIRECDAKRLNPKRARALAAFFLEIAAEAEKAQTGSLNQLVAATITPSSMEDRFLAEARDLVIRSQRANVSFVQRRLQVTYDRAVAIIEILERHGVVSPLDHKGSRSVLISNSALPPVQAEEAADDDPEAAPDTTASGSEFTTAPSEFHPGDRERLGHANPSGDEVSAEGAAPDGDAYGPDQSQHLADEFNQTEDAPASADTGARSGEEVDIPTFLRRGHADCPVMEPQGADADA